MHVLEYAYVSMYDISVGRRPVPQLGANVFVILLSEYGDAVWLVLYTIVTNGAPSCRIMRMSWHIIASTADTLLGTCL